MKGIIFAGCSFTWGQGLWFYSNLETMFYPETEFNFNIKNVNDSDISYKDILRYPRLVANHFKTFEIVKNPNGGSEEDSDRFIQQIFNGGHNTHLTEFRAKYDDISYIIIQTSQLTRNRFFFNLNGVEEWAIPWTSTNIENFDKFYEWINQNNLTFEEWRELHIETIMNKIVDIVNTYEEKGIRVRLLSWENDYLNFIKKNEILAKRFITLNYNDNEYQTIRDLMNENKNLTIKYDTDSFVNPPQDHHPSKKCHEVIAKNIIDLIESELKINPIVNKNTNLL